MAGGSMTTRHFVDLVEGWRSADGPAYVSLADRIRLLIVDGRLTVGTRLPGERDLAGRLRLSRTTVNSAFATLREQGYLTSRQGAGSVARLPTGAGELPVPRPTDLIDLSRATSSAGPGLERAARTALDRLPSRLGTDGYELAGLPELTAAIAERLTRRGLDTSPQQVIVTSGAQSALSLLAVTFLRRGDRVLVESPSYPHALSAFRSIGARLVSVGVTAEAGWDEREFEAAVRGASPVMTYLMPDFQNPTAQSLLPESRERFVELAEGRGVIVVVDETTAELDIDRARTPPPMGSFAKALGSVITVGSASKTIWGGLRVGWIRADAPVIDRLVAARFANDLGASVIDQLIVTESLHDFESILSYRRDIHRASRETLRHALAKQIPEWTMPPVPGGIAAWVQIGRARSTETAIEARNRGLLIGAGPWFGLNGAFERFIRIPITAPPGDIARAVDILASIWAP